MDITIQLARENEIEHAKKVVEEQYLKLGYLALDDELFFKSLAAYKAESYTLVATKNNQIIGTLTLIVDSPLGLPMDKIYAEENDCLRKGGRKLSELSQFAVKDGGLKCSLLLCKYAEVLADKVLGCSDFVITVNPKHCSFYRKILRFEDYSSEKEHPILEGAKTVPLRLNLITLEETYKSCSHKKRSLNLHDFFFGADIPDVEKELRTAIAQVK